MNATAIKTAALALVTLGWIAIASAAGMNTQLDNLYQDMESYTQGGSYETMRRSGYVGSRYSFRSQIVSENLITISAPYAKGGCGGIETFGGAFSYVNSDQLVALMKQVASNAKGYAFQLALDTMCSTCMKWMNELQAKTQEMVSHLSNSCQLAQGIVNSTFNEFPDVLRRGQEKEFTAQGIFSDVAEDAGDLYAKVGEAKTLFQRLKEGDSAAFDEQTGSVVYKAMMNQNFASWYPAGDHDLLEEIISIVGTMVITDNKNKPDPLDANNAVEEPDFNFLEGGLLTMEDLMFGARNKEIYDCDADNQTPHCRIEESDKDTRDIDGLKPKILAAFTGPNGLITWIRQGQLNADLNQSQQNILAAMPDALGTKIYNLAPRSPDAAEQLVNDTIDYITLEIVSQLVFQSLDAVRTAVKESEKSNTNMASQLKALDEAEKRLDEEYEDLLWRYNGESVDAKYDLIIRNLPKDKNTYETGNSQSGASQK